MPEARRGSSTVEQGTHKPLVDGSSPFLATSPLSTLPELPPIVQWAEAFVSAKVAQHRSQGFARPSAANFVGLVGAGKVLLCIFVMFYPLTIRPLSLY
jgi:hypothetical protein